LPQGPLLYIIACVSLHWVLVRPWNVPAQKFAQLATDRLARSVQDSPALFSYTKATTVRSFRVQFDVNLTLSVPSDEGDS
jgi:hypothetical protein